MLKNQQNILFFSFFVICFPSYGKHEANKVDNLSGVDQYVEIRVYRRILRNNFMHHACAALISVVGGVFFHSALRSHREAKMKKSVGGFAVGLIASIYPFYCLYDITKSIWYRIKNKPILILCREGIRLKDNSLIRWYDINSLHRYVEYSDFQVSDLLDINGNVRIDLEMLPLSYSKLIKEMKIFIDIKKGDSTWGKASFGYNMKHN